MFVYVSCLLAHIPYVVCASDSFFRRSLSFVNVFFVFSRGLVIFVFLCSVIWLWL